MAKEIYFYALFLIVLIITCYLVFYKNKNPKYSKRKGKGTKWDQRDTDVDRREKGREEGRKEEGGEESSSWGSRLWGNKSWLSGS